VHFPVYSKYFYSKLNEQEKKAYSTILNGWLSFKERIVLVNAKSNLDFNKIFKSICDDTPELFYIDFSRIEVSFMPGLAIVSASFICNKTESESIISKINDILLFVTKQTSVLKDKEKYIHDYLAENTQYNYDLQCFDAHTIKGALLDKSAVCEGYARAFKLLCDASKIPCMVVSGTAINTAGQTESHAWNIVRNNTSNFHVDVTWNSAMFGEGLSLYYNVSDAFIAKDHFWDASKWPTCKEQGALEKSIVSVTSINVLDNVLKMKVKNKEDKFLLHFTKKFPSTKEVIELLNDRFNANNLYEISAFSAAYNPRLSCVIVTVKY